ncbi:ABC transporter permease [Mycolicibacterium komossense]|uniref:ABC transporter permease n=1 Tax=Mycolicibacterium komossense TaxID=1779 RepID=A0ABT3CCV2_9MYCO|nr:ABC transporter permease [Mycolicibacterium komossense]MCV7227317.1 ABC transporter permease [Mycolicibacterium komossense]
MTTTHAPRADRRQALTAWALLAPGLLVVVALAVVPLVLVARNSVASADQYGRVSGGFTLDNFMRLTDPVYAKTLGYSLGMAALNTVFCLVVGYLVSYYIVSQPAGRQPLLLLLIIVPFWTDFLVRTFAWITLLGSGGPVFGLVKLLGGDGGSLIPSQTAVLLALLYAFLPTAVFPIYASMRGIDPALREAAADLGCGWWRTHARVIAPLTSPGIVAAALLIFVPTLGVFVIPVLLGGGKNLLVGNLIVTLYTEFRNQPMGAALSMVVLVLMLCSIAIAALILKYRNRGTRWSA